MVHLGAVGELSRRRSAEAKSLRFRQFTLAFSFPVRLFGSGHGSLVKSSFTSTNTAKVKLPSVSFKQRATFLGMGRGEGQGKKLGRTTCLAAAADVSIYHEMIAVKMVFAIFWGSNNKFGGQVPRCYVCGHCHQREWPTKVRVSNEQVFIQNAEKKRYRLDMW